MTTTMNASTPAAGFAANPQSTARGNFYLRAWRRVPRELGFLLLGLPIAVVGYSLTIALFSAGIGTLVTFFIGVVAIIGALYVSRGFGTLDLVRLDWAGYEPIPRPDWQQGRARPGFFGWLRSVLANAHYWLYLLHTMVIDFVVTTISWTIAVTWTSTALGGVTYWFWGRFLPQDGSQQWYLSDAVLWFLRVPPDSVDAKALDPLVYFGLGVVMLATLPFVTRGLTMVHYLIARALLGAFKSDALERQVAHLSESRGAAIAAEGHSLRRLERDIHDGPQQRLVRLQMDLAAAERQLAVDPEKARGLIGEAMQQSKDALDELRALSRGFAPPILMDRGLVPALESAAVRSTVPAHVASELPAGFELPQEIERGAYFVASEALTNAAKHSGATRIDVTVGLRRLPETDETWLDLTVTDDGRGGASPADGHGLAGLDERLRGLGGTLEVLSPEGGPTVVSAHLPITASVTSRTDEAGQLPPHL
jgi:signal transduction histidine kinase